MNTLLHICCAPCSIHCIQALRDENISPTGFWYNPNIHPFTEYKARKKALIEYANSIHLPLEIKNDYGLREFILSVAPNFDNRCHVCYTMRLRETAMLAAQKGFDSFCTTLLISPYQNHELLCEIAQQQADEFGVNFLYKDFRPGFRGGQQQARELNLYMQKYCGCIFSEEERYRKRKKSAMASSSVPKK